MLSWITALLKPLTEVYGKRQARKAAAETARAKLTQASADDGHELELNKDEWEALNVKGMGETWKDEYVTVSILAILNLLVLGGLASAFGYPQILQGVILAIAAISEVGVDIGFLMEAAVLAGLGLSIWKRF